LNKTTNEEFEIPVTGFFVAIGHKPNTDILKTPLDETGYIINVVGTAKYSRCFCIRRCCRPCLSSSNYRCRYGMYGST
jgi:alkyl hydroperoxide reductase subunit AhpF